jgi:hypothetical protein
MFIDNMKVYMEVWKYVFENVDVIIYVLVKLEDH